MPDDAQPSGTRVPIRIARPVGFGVDAGGNPTTIYAPLLRPRPPWPALPFDSRCVASASARPDVVDLIRKDLPGFDPVHDPKHWLWAAEQVMRSGRPKAEVQSMTYDEISAFFAVPRHPVASEAEREHLPVNKPSPNVEAADETAAEILNRMWKAPRERQRLIAAGSADGIAQLIGKGATAVKTAGIIWVENIKPALAAARYAAKIEREDRRRKGRS
jgi:hypothetical protein